MSSKMPSDSSADKTKDNKNDTKNDDQTGGVNSNKTNKNNTGWVQFDEEGSSPPAVIATESVQVNIDRSKSQPKTIIKPLPPDTVIPVIETASTLRTIELGNNEVVRQGFSNGDVVVTLLPVNTRWPWITPAQFRPELVPEELMAQGLTLTVEEYVQALELLVNDVRFSLYNVCYKRVLVVWITLAFSLLLGLLFSGLSGLLLFGLGVLWLVLNATAIFMCMWIKIRLARGLERCLAHVNKQLLRHKLVVALDDRGKISCHKVNLCFLYLDPGPCIAHLQSSIDQQERDPNIGNGWEQRMDITANDIVIQGSRTTRLSRKQERATLLHLRYVSRWGKNVLRGSLTFSAIPSRHCPNVLCPCQFIEEHLSYKPEGYPCSWCAYGSSQGYGIYNI